MRIVLSLGLAFLLTAPWSGAPAFASPPVMNLDPAEEAEFVVETKVLSVETRPPKTAEGTETTELLCIVTKVVKEKTSLKTRLSVGSRLSLVGTCQRHAKPMGAREAGYPSDRCDAGAWTAPYWMKQQAKEQPLTLYLRHATSDGKDKPVLGKLETVADRRPGPTPATVTLLPVAATKK